MNLLVYSISGSFKHILLVVGTIIIVWLMYLSYYVYASTYISILLYH